MAMQEPWGVALVIFEAERAALPMGFDETAVDTDVLTAFNQTARSVCETAGLPYTHENTTRVATGMLVEMLRPLLADGEAFVDSDQLRTMLGVVSRVSNTQFYILRVGDACVSFLPLAGGSLHDVHEQGGQVIDLVEDERGERLEFYYPFTREVN